MTDIEKIIQINKRWLENYSKVFKCSLHHYYPGADMTSVNKTHCSICQDIALLDKLIKKREQITAKQG